MAAKKIYDAVCVIGEYTNKDGETKRQYLNVGSVFEGEKGMSLKLEAMPVSGFNGWISFYVPKEKTGGQPAAQQSKPVNGGLDDMDDDLPF